MMRKSLLTWICVTLLFSINVDAEDDFTWLQAEAKRQLEECWMESASGFILYTPDGMAHYQAQWTRDFYYFYKYAGDLIDPFEVKGIIKYLLAGQREDGCIPDRVNQAGTPVYSPGPEHRLFPSRTG